MMVRKILPAVFFGLITALSFAPPVLCVANEVIDFNNEGVAALNERNYKQAIEKFSAALKLDPTYKLAIENLSVAYNNLGIDSRNDKKEALSCFRKALYYSPGDESTADNLSNTIRNLGLNPDSFEDRMSFVKEAIAGKDFAGAFVELTFALKIKEDSAARAQLNKIRSYIPFSNAANEAILMAPAVKSAATRSGDSSGVVAAQLQQPVQSTAAVTTTDAAEVSKNGLLTLDEARRYLLKIINRDRVANKLNALEMDPIATTAGQAHADEGARRHRLSHWSIDGRKPVQRYTEAGGQDYVMENGYGVRDLPSNYVPSDPPLFDRKELDECHRSMMTEVPPDDGHKQNILNPTHTHLGVGLSALHQKDYPQILSLYVAEEFVTRKGTYSPLPPVLVPGVAVNFEGKLDQGYTFDAVHIYKEPLPKPINPAPAGGYSLAPDYVISAFPSRPLPESRVDTNGESFKGSFTPGPSWKPALYYIYVWAKPPGQKKSVVVSLRAIPLRAKS
ncbi:MAG: tetratricopeptide repeat protein [Candidatus Obscuribacterales bacterium]|nr:tetratricopeptide repeat protein [Candidatus Obscuribacterales bacterium]